MARVYYQLVGHDGHIYMSAGQRYLLEEHLTEGFYFDTDDEDDLVRLPLPPGCQVVEVGDEAWAEKEEVASTLALYGKSLRESNVPANVVEAFLKAWGRG